jgi:hypothetical protein
MSVVKIKGRSRQRVVGGIPPQERRNEKVAAAKRKADEKPGAFATHKKKP